MNPPDAAASAGSGGAAASSAGTVRGRHETQDERSDRNWGELLQELRVTQTGAQILTGFLLTVPFQSRFTELDDVQVTAYLVLVCLSVLATGFLIAPVSLHRAVFGRRVKAELVSQADHLARAGIATLGLALIGTLFLLFDVVGTRAAAIAAGLVGAGALVVLWLVVPLALRRRARSSRRSDGQAAAPAPERR